MCLPRIRASRNIVQLVHLAAVCWIANCITGCVGARAYFVDRGRDAADVLTASIGTGGGALMRVGPVHAGVLVDLGDGFLRGGEFAPFLSRSAQIHTTVVPFPSVWRGERQYPVFGLEGYEGWGNGLLRSKGFEAVSKLPFVTTGLRASSSSVGYPYYYYTQVEAVLAVGLSIRLGVNFGELLDFVLGWVTIDIFADDLEAERRRNAAVP